MSLMNTSIHKVSDFLNVLSKEYLTALLTLLHNTDGNVKVHLDFNIIDYSDVAVNYNDMSVFMN